MKKKRKFAAFANTAASMRIALSGDDLTCIFNFRKLTRDPQAHINFDLDARQISLDSGMDASKVQAILAEAGYPTTPA